jgi:PAS domain S-box-containing protein
MEVFDLILSYRKVTISMEGSVTKMPNTEYSILMSMFEHMNEGIIVTDKDGNFIFMNNSAEKIHDIKKETLLNKNVYTNQFQESLSSIKNAIEQLKQSPRSVLRWMMMDSVNKRFYENTYSAIFDENNNVSGIAVITRDITARKRIDLLKARGAKPQRDIALDTQLKYKKLLLISLESLLNEQEAKDGFMKGHSKRVAEISQKMFEYKFGIKGEYFDIGTAARLHDIGKISIPNAIMDKPGKLSLEEYEAIKQHCEFASDLIKPLDATGTITSIIRYHHERYDGSGYPEGRKGEDIPLGSRIIAIADTYDAMRSDRPFRKALAQEFCTEEIKKNAGTQFDPEWADVFCTLRDKGSIQ